MDLARKRIVVGMTGGIAAYKVCELVRRLQDEGAEVQVVMTAGARQFVSATTMQALSGRPVFTEQWGDEAQGGNAMPHINLTRGVDAIVVAPATAHFIAKAARDWPTTCSRRWCWRATGRPPACWSHRR